MSGKDPFAEASKLLPGEDPDEINLAAWRATWRWRKMLAPFLEIEFPHISWEMERIGRRLTTHVDAEERERRKAKSRSLAEIMADVALDAEIARYFAIHDAALIEEVDAAPDIIAAGW